MKLQVRDGKLDVAIVAGPRLDVWPSAGVRSLMRLSAEMGLTVGTFGGEAIAVRGVVPLPGTGGLVIAQDVQNRVHRIRARAVVKVFAPSQLPDPFAGWRLPGLIPLATAVRLRRESQVSWDPGVAILGTGNKALRFGSELLEAGVSEVVCVENSASWGAKRYAGWEVEHRRFDLAGGKIIEARPVSLKSKSALLWELRLQDTQGIRVLEISHVVSAGPFREFPEVREHPRGSFLFEMDQTAPGLKTDDVEGWVLEEERGRYLAGKIVRALATDLGERRDELDRIYKRARGRLKRYFRHREEPFSPAYQGKWMAPADSRQMREFSGIPRTEHRTRKLASIECFEQIPCNICMSVCPESAIEIGKVPRPEGVKILNEARCSACGICVQACPSSAISLLQEREDRSMSSLVVPWRGPRPWKASEFATLVNRRGDTLGTARVLDTPEILGTEGRDLKSSNPTLQEALRAPVQLVEIEVPTHLIWEARGLKRPKANSAVDEAYMEAVARSSEAAKKVEITLNGDKRLVRDQISMTVALFEMGENRPEDALFCRDGSCGLCTIQVDGVKKLACQTTTHRGMAVKLSGKLAATQGERSLCPCLGITSEQVVERMAQARLQSPEAVLSVTPVGEGKCHGQLCGEAFKRLLQDQGVDASQWVDWRFPWSDWVLTQG